MLVALPLAASVASFPLCARQRSSASLWTLQSRLFAYRFSRAIARIFEARGLNVVQLSLAGASKRFHDELYIYIYIYGFNPRFGINERKILDGKKEW